MSENGVCNKEQLYLFSRYFCRKLDKSLSKNAELNDESIEHFSNELRRCQRGILVSQSQKALKHFIDEKKQFIDNLDYKSKTDGKNQLIQGDDSEALSTQPNFSSPLSQLGEQHVQEPLPSTYSESEVAIENIKPEIPS